MTGQYFFKLYSPATASSNYNITRIMFYYRIFVSDISYKGVEPLTYSCSKRLDIGSIVRVPLKNKYTLGFVVAPISAPKFNTKSIDFIYELPQIPLQSINLATWLLSYYPSSIGSTSQMFLPGNLNNLQRLDMSHRQYFPKKLPPLTSDQKRVLEKIGSTNETYILHGETASGKTRIYIELAKKVIANRKSAIVLTPEIGLTPQLVKSFTDYFGENMVVVTHSRLTPKARKHQWVRILESKDPIIVIGPRSALFSPIRNLGMIVIDESHEPSYKQDQMPHYLTVRVSSKLAQLHDAPLIMGSATPSVTDYYYAQAKNKPILRMAQKALALTDSNAVKISLIDLKDRKQFSRSAHLSDTLLKEVDTAISKGRQSMLFLNRRGTARIVLCNNCGWQALCPNCNLPLTYHADKHVLQCHTCGFKQHPLSSCPVCSNTEIILKSIGTKFIVDEITSIFPNAKTKRFDTDNSKPESLEQNYYNLMSGDVDIIVGTQMLVKGLDLPNLSMVGVINADTSLHFPDYTAGERTYQLLRQVIGRVGRGYHDGNAAVIQSYDTENSILHAAVHGNWDEFYSSEINERKKYDFPPFTFLLKLTCRRASANSASKTALDFATRLSGSDLRITIEGPTPSFHEKIGDKFQWQLLIKSKNRQELIKVIRLLPSGWSYDIDPLNLL